MAQENIEITREILKKIDPSGKLIEWLDKEYQNGIYVPSDSEFEVPVTDLMEQINNMDHEGLMNALCLIAISMKFRGYEQSGAMMSYILKACDIENKFINGGLIMARLS